MKLFNNHNTKDLAFIFYLLFSSIILNGQFFEIGSLGVSLKDSAANSLGANWVDYNQDGSPDLFVVNDLGRNHLFENQGSGSFIEILDGPLVLDSANSWSATWGDFNNDGFIDVFVANWGTETQGAINYLYQNNGELGFTRLDLAGLSNTLFHSASCSWIDLDKDGFLDLVISNGLRFGKEPNECYLNNGDNTFSAYETEFTLDSFQTAGVTASDIDLDGDQDLLIAKENGANLIYLNESGELTLFAAGDISSTPGNSRGVTMGDIDGDGDFDAFVSNWANQNNKLYLNDGLGAFHAVLSSELINDGGKSEGVTFLDLENDGDLDVVVCNWGNQRNNLYINDGGLNFSDLLTDTFASYPGNSVACPVADYNSDGVLDLFISQVDKPEGQENLLFSGVNSSNNYIRIELDGILSNKSAIGALLYLYYDNKQVLREIRGQNGFGNFNELIVHFGLGASNSIDSLEIIWPSGIRQIEKDILVNQVNSITEKVPTGIDIMYRPEIYCYPNPFVDKIYLSNLPTTPIDIKLVQSDSRIYTLDMNADLSINISKHLPIGMYILVLRFENGNLISIPLLH